MIKKITLVLFVFLSALVAQGQQQKQDTVVLKAIQSFYSKYEEKARVLFYDKLTGKQTDEHLAEVIKLLNELAAELTRKKP